MKIIRFRNIFLSALLLSITSPVIGSISVKPSRIEGKIPAGKSYDNVFEVVNPGDKPAKIKVSWEDRTINPVNKSWFKLATDNVVVPAGGSASVKYTITIPEKSSGEYNAWAVFTAEPVAGIMGADLALRISVPVYIAVSGTQKYDFEVGKINISNLKKTTFGIYVTNTGNVHIRPAGNIVITSIDRSNEKYTIPFNDIKWGIIPNECIEYKSSFKEDMNLKNGKYKAVIDIQAGEEENMKTFSKEFEFSIENNIGKITGDNKTKDIK